MAPHHTFWQNVLFYGLLPPIMACLVWLMSRGWAMGVQGGTVSGRTKKRQRIEFWGVLIAGYVIEVIITTYAVVKR